jgi:transketolase
MRNAFADEMTRLATDRKDVALLSGDIGNKLFDKFKAAAPDRFLNCGVAEANMMSVAAGMALNGLRPVVYTITPFITTRCLEQIRVDVCYHGAPVIIVGVGSGLGYASLGPTHHSCEDIAMLRSLPGMTVLCPGDAWEVRALLRAAVALGKPVYMRIGKKGEPAVHSGVPALTIGKAATLREGRDVCLVSTGVLLPLALETADTLAAAGLSASVVQMHTVKPLDGTFLADAFNRYKVVATIEEHSLIGGLGGATAEWLVDHGPQSARLCRFGTRDEFLHESGETEHARHYFGLTPDAIAATVTAAYGTAPARAAHAASA